ncbi:Methyltransferase domain-containing protein [Streptomyces sp. yr375]|uniref:class I SAM-dependent methyltransferase n=1 Tax=Streptomyces sp. yr375 TaxID=1761906 RepID=UPI0008AF1743|nr:class I SAM-dependent methyltransferase [Streptomyces sp. yr375]SES49392.1 Methyltransferase domain-containing protein [Streptomyces sp. yr375]
MSTPFSELDPSVDIEIRGRTVRIDEARRLIEAHPQVAAVRLEVRRSPSGVSAADRLVAHVVPDGPLADKRTPEAEVKRVRDWKAIYEWVYGEMPEAGGLGDDFVGWHSSYDGKPIEREQMREWRDATVRRVLSLRPRRVLEIGVGTGLLMANIAPHVESYTATDFSPTAIDRLRAKVAEVEWGDRVELLVGRADELSGLPTSHYDVVVCNSVVQYFPTARYLADMVTAALGMARPGGAVFIGDVRNLRTLPAFRTAVLAPELPADPVQARDAVELSTYTERELAVDPDLFAAVLDEFPGGGTLDLRIKRAVHHNELSRHRYDAVLHRAPLTAPAVSTPTDTVELAWGDQVADLSALETALAAEPGPVRVTGVPNARLRHETEAARLLEALAGPERIAAELAREPGAQDAPDPEEFHTLADRLGRGAVLTWAASGAPDLLDVLLLPTGTDGTGGIDGPVAAYRPAAPLTGDFSRYANDPSRSVAATAFATTLRADLAATMPPEFLPDAFVAQLDAGE